jgi:hypothetical protein
VGCAGILVGQFDVCGLVHDTVGHGRWSFVGLAKVVTKKAVDAFPRSIAPTANFVWLLSLAQ